MSVCDEKIAGLARKYQDATVYQMDGVSVEYPDWHFNVRPSNTEPLLRLNLEGQTPELMETKRDEVLAYIRVRGSGSGTETQRSAVAPADAADPLRCPRNARDRPIR